MRAVKNLFQKHEDHNDNGSEPKEDRKEIVEDLFEKAEAYFKTNIELAKLKLTDKVADVVGALVTQIAIILVIFFFFLMINMGIAFWLGTIVGTTHVGFIIVAGFYLLVCLLLFAFRKTILKNPISNSIISQILK
ncbi:MAG TPA: phage holin family protein [Saprospiraceae bacterium]|nr:phage holin family protein [Saprospiraceae bacterium]